ncbi:plastidial pyruvate kinase 4, chloroplastic-like [Iris pallida]|uniref:pyruvate kinase n=1 Tax=Iris pallida TaxID=29817 RepID=A0AAX6GP08_IRIPA|nr:plastidial pyruvate kinase 4, chloroplastic-like [Iris pallida]
MKLSAISAYWVAQTGFFPNHGLHNGNHPDLTCTSNCQTSISKLGYALSSPILRNKLVQLQARSKNQQRFPRVLVKLKGNNKSESNNRKTHEDMLYGVAQKSEGTLSSEDSYAMPRKASSFPEDDSDCQSIPRQEPSLYPCDRQVYLDKLRAIHLHVLASEQWNSSRLKLCHRTYLVSATNLIHYLALHSLDVQQLNEDLSSIGLMNLERANSYVLASITAGIQMLENQAPHCSSREQSPLHASLRDCITSQETEVLDFSISSMRRRASMHAMALLGPAQGKKNVQIMITVGREAIANEMLLPDLLKAGANIIRINCAYDDSSIWSEIIRLAKHSSQMLEKPCRILMDLAGPKLRTGLLENGPSIMKISPQKDVKGCVIFPAQVWLSFPGCGPPRHLSPDAVLFVESKRFLDKLEVGNVVRFVDARGRKRSLQVSKKHTFFAGYGYIAECTSTAYVEASTRLHIERKKGKDIVSRIVDIPSADHYVRLRVGDLLTIHRTPSFPVEEQYSSSPRAPRISCDSGRLFDSVKPGEPIAFDDGKIWGVIQGASSNEIVVSITQASPKGSKLGSGKSINIPQSEMQFEGLTSKDVMDLEFVGANADMVGISFVRDVCDITVVMKELQKRKLEQLGVVLKIETRSGFEKLPLLLLQAMQSPNPLGIMIARGDLAVECGWEKMASIQEEILSVCNAAHVPTIWATQVLETLVKSGIPTRAEITDVACGMRSNCIMLNKGKNIVEAVSSLESIICNSRKSDMKTLLKPLLLSS